MYTYLNNIFRCALGQRTFICKKGTFLAACQVMPFKTIFIYPVFHTLLPFWPNKIVCAYFYGIFLLGRLTLLSYTRLLSIKKRLLEEKKILFSFKKIFPLDYKRVVFWYSIKSLKSCVEEDSNNYWANSDRWLKYEQKMLVEMNPDLTLQNGCGPS